MQPKRTAKEVEDRDRFQIVEFRKLKNTKAWKLISELVRRKALINPKEKNRKKWLCKCYTCERIYPYEDMCAGHFREKLGGANGYFDYKRNIRAQCGWYCNRQKHGNKEEFSRKLVLELGPDILNELFLQGQQSKVWTKYELNQIATKVEEEISKL